MPDARTDTTVHLGENSPEEVALKLLRIVGDLEERPLFHSGKNPADRKWLLDTYAECLDAVRGNRRLP